MYVYWTDCTASLQRQRDSTEVAVRQAEISRLLTLRGDDLWHFDRQGVPQTDRLRGRLRSTHRPQPSAVAPVSRLLEVS